MVSFICFQPPKGVRTLTFIWENDVTLCPTMFIFHILKNFETLLEPKTCWVIRIQNPKLMKVHTSKKVIIKVVYRSAAFKRTLSNSTFTNVQKTSHLILLYC